MHTHIHIAETRRLQTQPSFKFGRMATVRPKIGKMRPKMAKMRPKIAKMRPKMSPHTPDPTRRFARDYFCRVIREVQLKN